MAPQTSRYKKTKLEVDRFIKSVMENKMVVYVLYNEIDDELYGVNIEDAAVVFEYEMLLYGRTISELVDVWN